MLKLRRSRALEVMWYKLTPATRAFIESLKTDPIPDASVEFEIRPGVYEFFIDEVWIGWTINKSSGEDIVEVEIFTL